MKKLLEVCNNQLVELAFHDAIRKACLIEEDFAERLDTFLESCMNSSSRKCEQIEEALSSIVFEYFVESLTSYFPGDLLAESNYSYSEAGNLLAEAADYYGDAEVFKTAVKYTMSKGMRAMPTMPEFKTGAGVMMYNTLSNTYFSGSGAI